MRSLSGVLVSFILVQSVLSQTTPSFLWSNGDFFRGRNQQVVDPTPAFALQDIFSLGSSGDSPLKSYVNSKAKAEAIVLFLEPSLNSEQVSILADAYAVDSTGGALSNLKDLVENAKSSLVLPYVFGSIEQSVVSPLIASLPKGASLIIAKATGTHLLSAYSAADSKTTVGATSVITLDQLLEQAKKSDWSILHNDVTDIIVVCFASPSVSSSNDKEAIKAYQSDDAVIKQLDHAFKKSTYVALFASEAPVDDSVQTFPVFHDVADSNGTVVNQNSYPGDWLFPDAIVQALLVMAPFMAITGLAVYCNFGLQSELRFDLAKKQ